MTKSWGRAEQKFHLLHEFTPSRLGEGIVSYTLLKLQQSIKPNEEMRNMFEVKEQGKTSERNRNKMEVSILSDKDFQWSQR